MPVSFRPWHSKRDRSVELRWPAHEPPVSTLWAIPMHVAGPRLSYAVVADALTVGRITLRGLVEWQARIGIWLEPSTCGRGVGSAVLPQFLRFCFETVGLQRLQLDVAQQNRRAVALYERCGFSTVAHECRVAPSGVTVEYLEMQQLADEWRARCASSSLVPIGAAVGAAV